jgi:hypothetical protein
MTRTILARLTTILVTLFFVMALAGCKKDISLVDDGGNIIGKGELEVTANSPFPARLTLYGKKYIGEWNSKKIYEEDLARHSRLIGGHAYATYMIGNDSAQLKHGHASFAAADGSGIECDFYYRNQPNAGSCYKDGIQLHLTVQ